MTLITTITTSDLFGRFFVRKPDGVKWDCYYRTLNALRPLFSAREFTDVVSGFFLNVTGDFDAARISYFLDSTNAERAMHVFKDFFTTNGMVQTADAEPPRPALIARDYGGEELEARFRNFLLLATQIGLDLIGANLVHARALFATYRWQIRKASLTVRVHFEPAFQKYSPTYNSLADDQKDQFFHDLAAWPNPPQVDWAHMMVNFVLGADWTAVFSDPHYPTPGQPLSIAEINDLVRELGFQIPLGWKP